MVSLFANDPLWIKTCDDYRHYHSKHYHSKKNAKNLHERIVSSLLQSDSEVTQTLLVELIDNENQFYEADIRTLLDHIAKKGCNLNFMVEKQNLSFINYAVTKRVSPTTLTLLLENGCALRSSDGQNSLLLALENEITQSKKDHRLIKVLLEHGANPKAIGDLLKEFKITVQAMNQSDCKRALHFIKKIESHIKLAKERINRPRFVICRLFINESLEPFPLPIEVAYKIAEHTFPYSE